MLLNKSRRTPSIRTRWLLVPISVLALFSLGASGSIISLSTSGGGSQGDTIAITATVHADDKVNNSNFYFEIRAPDGTVVDTNSADVPRLENGDSYSYGWNSNNSGYPSMGNYTVFMCWSTGNSRNCDIAQATTSFYSVPTMGKVLTGVSLLLFAIWLWSVRHKLFPERSLAR